MPEESLIYTVNLPEDVTILQRMVTNLSELLAEAKNEFAKQLSEKDSIIERFKHELLLLRNWKYGQKSEKAAFVGQMSLFPVEAPLEISKPESSDKTVKKKGHGRKTLPASLPVERIEIAVSAEDKICTPCGSEKIRIGEETRREIDYKPGTIYIREIVRPIYACPNECEGQIVVADNPSAPIEKGLPGPGLLAHIVVSKYADHLPLNRLEGILARAGVDLRRSTMADWMALAAFLLTTLVEEMKRRVLQSEVIHTDDTPVTVQDAKKKDKPHKGRIWVYSGDRYNPYDIYEFSPNRQGMHPQEFLKDWHGFLQADAYAGYDMLFANGAIEVACWAHARRKFVEAEKSDRRAAEAILKIRELFRIEKRIKEVAAKMGWSFSSIKEDGDKAEEFRRRRRAKLSQPVLVEIEAWLRGPACSTALPKSPFGEAVGYCLNNWSALCEFAKHGELSIDNNPAERKLRPIAVGRKNYLFFGSDAGGHTAANLYTVIASAKRHGLDPWRYLQDVFSRIPDMTVSQITELLPDRWKESQTK